MSKKWPTKEKDLQVAQLIMEDYARQQNTESLGLLELVVNQHEKRMNFRLASWVLALAQHYIEVYGVNQGDYITRQVVSLCMVQGNNQQMH